jgi:uncharacterized protein (DUF1697 family)
MPTHIALLRGINLGATNRVSMPELRELLTGLGYEDVRTLLQSGNIVLRSRKAPKTLERALEDEIADALGVRSTVVVRTRDELADVIDHDPLGDLAGDPKRHVVYFLNGTPDAGAVKALADADHSPEAFAARGRELYTWHPEGIQRSPLVRKITEKRLGVAATARNWNTVTKLLALADEG